MVALIALGYVTSEQKNLAIGLLTLAVGINAATYLGFQVSKKITSNNTPRRPSLAKHSIHSNSVTTSIWLPISLAL